MHQKLELRCSGTVEAILIAESLVSNICRKKSYSYRGVCVQRRENSLMKIFAHKYNDTLKSEWDPICRPEGETEENAGKRRMNESLHTHEGADERIERVCADWGRYERVYCENSWQENTQKSPHIYTSLMEHGRVLNEVIRREKSLILCYAESGVLEGVQNICAFLFLHSVNNVNARENNR